MKIIIETAMNGVVVTNGETGEIFVFQNPVKAARSTSLKVKEILTDYFAGEELVQDPDIESGEE